MWALYLGHTDSVDLNSVRWANAFLNTVLVTGAVQSVVVMMMRIVKVMMIVTTVAYMNLVGTAKGLAFTIEVQLVRSFTQACLIGLQELSLADANLLAAIMATAVVSWTVSALDQRLLVETALQPAFTTFVYFHVPLVAEANLLALLLTVERMPLIIASRTLNIQMCVMFALLRWFAFAAHTNITMPAHANLFLSLAMLGSM